jgi:hypothetical protein
MPDPSGTAGIDLTGLYAALDQLSTTLTLGLRDCSRHPGDAWMYGILIGWPDEPHPAADATMAQVAERHGWHAIDVKLLRELRHAVESLDVNTIGDAWRELREARAAAELLVRQQDDLLARCAAAEKSGSDTITVAEVYATVTTDPADDDPAEEANDADAHRCPTCQNTTVYPADLANPPRAVLLQTAEGREELRRQVREVLAARKESGRCDSRITRRGAVVRCQVSHLHRAAADEWRDGDSREIDNDHRCTTDCFDGSAGDPS